MKHIDTRYHFVRERIATEEGGVEYVNTKDNVADLLAKAVSADVMETLRPESNGAVLRSGGGNDFKLPRVSKHVAVNGRLPMTVPVAMDAVVTAYSVLFT
ncbi:hypothetical protein PC110_g835 [Phytophthora cactorum]|uniref:Uncharacterized protein n=1 Tax=Phytophthora cactorum TaxID=29920 RepID=A0A329T2Z5_9STRA|nr:hypothetical protein PC110_g835 [Phytophthora cactorum]